MFYVSDLQVKHMMRQQARGCTRRFVPNDGYNAFETLHVTENPTHYYTLFRLMEHPLLVCLLLYLCLCCNSDRSFLSLLCLRYCMYCLDLERTHKRRMQTAKRRTTWLKTTICSAQWATRPSSARPPLVHFHALTHVHFFAFSRLLSFYHFISFISIAISFLSYNSLFT